MWPIDRRRRRRGGCGSPDSSPWLLVEDRRGQRVVAARCERAVELGVRVGMTLAHARALAGAAQPRVERYEPERDAVALQALARWAMRFTPRVGTDPPDGLLMDVTGCERLYHGLPNLLRLVLGSVRRLGFGARAAIGPTAGCAWAVTRYGAEGSRIVTEDDAEAVVAALPVAALRLDTPASEALSEVAIDRVEHLLAIPREQLADRFGHVLLHRLDAALGHADDPLEPVQRVEAPSVEREFPGPVTGFEAVQIAARGLVEALCGLLDARKLGALQLILALDRYEAGPVREVLEVSTAERDPKHVWSVMRPVVERVNLGRGVERITLTASRTASLPTRQLGWVGEGGPEPFDPAGLGRVVDLLKGRLGEDAVLQPRLVDTHVPEAAFRLEPVTTGSMQQRAEAPPPPLGQARPPIMLDRPEPAEVMLLRPEGPVLSLRWRGEPRRIVTAVGPEAISGRWWLGNRPGEASPSRSYYRVQDEAGRWLWVFRETHSRKWFVHGTWG